jgi:hypothetical protein
MTSFDVSIRNSPVRLASAHIAATKNFFRCDSGHYSITSLYECSNLEAIELPGIVATRQLILFSLDLN